MARSNRVRAIVTPVLDVMQTIPSFVYLIPVVMLLGIGKVPGLLAVCIYAIPPIVRLTNLGIRLVDREVLEAADAFGASYRQKLFGVQVPLALPNIFAGVNQTIMMAPLAVPPGVQMCLLHQQPELMLTTRIVLVNLSYPGLALMAVQGLAPMNTP